jgi:hypothetical protein
LEINRLRPLAGVNLLAIGRLHARNLEAPVGANDRETIRLDTDYLAELAADTLRIFRRQRFGIENLQLFTV